MTAGIPMPFRRSSFIIFMKFTCERALSYHKFFCIQQRAAYMMFSICPLAKCPGKSIFQTKGTITDTPLYKYYNLGLFCLFKYEFNQYMVAMKSFALNKSHAIANYRTRNEWTTSPGWQLSFLLIGTICLGWRYRQSWFYMSEEVCHHQTKA